MTIILWIVLGALCGWVASMITGDNGQMGPVANIIVGIIGGLIGGTLYNFATTGTLDFANALSKFDLGSILLGILGSIVLLMILKFFNKSPKF